MEAAYASLKEDSLGDHCSNSEGQHFFNLTGQTTVDDLDRLCEHYMPDERLGDMDDDVTYLLSKASSISKSYTASIHSRRIIRSRPEILRTVSSSQVLASFGAIFADYTKFEVGATRRSHIIRNTVDEVHQHAHDDPFFYETRQATRTAALISHVWLSSRWSKALALHYHSNVQVATLGAIVVHFAILIFNIMTIGRGRFSGLGGMNLLVPLVYVPILIFVLLLLFGHLLACGFLDQDWWLDKFCIHQRRDDLKQLGVSALPEFVASADRMIILWDELYFQRLWCNAELATFCAVNHGVEKVDFMPLWLATWVLSSMLVDMIVCTILHKCRYAGPLTGEIYGALLERFGTSPLSMFLANSLFCTCVRGMCYLPLLIPNYLSCRERVKNYSFMIQQMRHYRLQDAECTVEDDRPIVEQHVGRLFQDLESEATPWEELAAEQQAEAVARFNIFVQNDFKAMITHRIGDVTFVRYPFALLICLPSCFYASFIYMTCDGDVCKETALMERFASEQHYLIASAFWQATNALLMEPMGISVLVSSFVRANKLSSNRLRVPLCCFVCAGVYFYVGLWQGATWSLLTNAMYTGSWFWITSTCLSWAALLSLDYSLFQGAGRRPSSVSL